MYDENGQDTNQEKDTRLHELLMASADLYEPCKIPMYTKLFEIASRLILMDIHVERP